MTGRTHDLAAFTALNAAFFVTPLQSMSFATFVVCLATNFIGGLAPDLDKTTSSLWNKIRGGKILAVILSPLLGGHRLISHSLVGLGLAGLIFHFCLQACAQVLIVDASVVWWSFMIGYASHLLVDSFTKEGLPLLFPFSWSFGMPPWSRLRITTGAMVEKSLVYPGLMIFNGYFFYRDTSKYLDFLQKFLG